MWRTEPERKSDDDGDGNNDDDKADDDGDDYNDDDEDDKCGEVIQRGKSANKGLCASAIPYLHHSNMHYLSVFVHLCVFVCHLFHISTTQMCTSCVYLCICVYLCVIPFLIHSNICALRALNCALFCTQMYNSSVFKCVELCSSTNVQYLSSAFNYAPFCNQMCTVY